jgi:hypothetical protein
MYAFHDGRLTARRDINVVAFIYTTAPESLIDKHSKNARIPIGIVRAAFTLRKGDFRERIASVVSCIAAEF